MFAHFPWNASALGRRGQKLPVAARQVQSFPACAPCAHRGVLSHQTLALHTGFNENSAHNVFLKQSSFGHDFLTLLAQ